MDRRRFGTAAALLLAAGAAALPAHADDVHYQDYPVGNRAAGLAGAFTALSNDPSGAFYNPAGLVGTTRSHVSVSTSLYGFESNEVRISPDRVFRLNIVPSEVGSLHVLGGDAQRDRNARAAWGLDVVVPSSRTGELRERIKRGDGWSDYRSESTDRTLWAGVAGALAIDDRLSVGLSLFYVHRTLVLNERATTFDSAGRSFREELNEVDVADGSAVARLGVRLRREPWLFGLMVETPSVHLRQAGSVRLSRAESGGASPALLRERHADTQDGTLRVRTALGGSARLGVAHLLGKIATVSCDLSLHLPVDYTRFSFADDAVHSELRLPRQVSRLATMNGACGGELRFHRSASLAAGAFTDFSSAREARFDARGLLVDDPASTLPHVDLFGGTIGLGFFGDHSLTRVGLTMAAGGGSDVRFQAERGGWVEQQVRQFFVFAYVASTFRY